MTPIEKLRYHVTGAIERGEAEAIVEVPMTQEKWSAMSPAQRDKERDLSSLTPQLLGLEGWRVEVVTSYEEKRRFIVSRSTGWIPVHIELNNIRSRGGDPAEREYKSVRKIRQERSK